jgi:hypothetical protein
MALSFVVVCEASGDYLTATELADRVHCDSVDWIEPDLLDAFRRYTGLPGNEPFLTRRRVKALAKESQLLPRGLLDGRPGDLDAQQTRRALLFIESKWPEVDGILLIRDDDGLKDRRRGLEPARDASPLHQRVSSAWLTPSASAGSWRVSRLSTNENRLFSRKSSKNSALIPVLNRSN